MNKNLFNKSASAWSEWRGLFFAFVWFFCSNNNYYPPFFSNSGYMFCFMMLLAASLFLVSVFLNSRPAVLSRVAGYATLAGTLCTLLIPFLNVPAAFLLYLISAILMAPLLSRRLYGLMTVVTIKNRFRTYMAAVSVTIIVNITWASLELPFRLKFSLIAASGLLGLLGIGRKLPDIKAKESLPCHKSIFSYQWLQLIGIVLLLFALNIFSTLVHSFIVIDGIDNNNLYMLASAMLLPIAGFMTFAFFADFKQEKWGFILAITLILLGCVLTLLPNDSLMFLPLVLAVEFGATSVEYYLLTGPLMFFETSNKPVLIASLGLIVHTLTFAFLWIGDLWLPHFLLTETPSRPLVIFGAICAILLFPLSVTLWENQKEATLIKALLSLRDLEKSRSVLPEPDRAETRKITPETISGGSGNDTTADWIASYDLLPREHDIALLLCRGLNSSEISEELVISVATVREYMNSLHTKIDKIPPLGRSLLAARMIEKYKLTEREAEVFDELLLGRSNREISDHMFIVESTVKFHVRNILKKAGVSNRLQLIEQLRKSEKLPFTYKQDEVINRYTCHK